MRAEYSVRLVCSPAGRADDSNLNSFAMASWTETERRAAGLPSRSRHRGASAARRWRSRGHLDVLLLGRDDALPHEEAVVLEELAVLLRLLLALVQQEADHPLLQHVAQLPEQRRTGRLEKNGVQGENSEFYFDFIMNSRLNIPEHVDFDDEE